MESHSEEKDASQAFEMRSQASSSKSSRRSSRSSASVAATRARAKAEAARAKAYYAEKEAAMMRKKAEVEADLFVLQSQKKKQQLQHLPKQRFMRQQPTLRREI